MFAFLFALYLFGATLIASIASLLFFVGVACGKLEETAQNRGSTVCNLVIALAAITIITCFAWPIMVPGLVYNQYRAKKFSASQDTVNFKIVS